MGFKRIQLIVGGLLIVLVVVAGVVLYRNSQGKKTGAPVGPRMERGINPQFVAIEGQSQFTLRALPEVTFKIRRIVRGNAVPNPQTGCLEGMDEEFRRQFFIGAGGPCFSGGAPLTFIAVHLTVQNNSPAGISGDVTPVTPNALGQLAHLFYENEGKSRLAEPYLNFRSYSVGAFQEKEIGLGFIVPADQQMFQFVYGYYGENYPSGEQYFAKTEGGFVIDFQKMTVSVIPG